MDKDILIALAAEAAGDVLLEPETGLILIVVDLHDGSAGYASTVKPETVAQVLASLVSKLVQ